LVDGAALGTAARTPHLDRFPSAVGDPGNALTRAARPRAVACRSIRGDGSARHRKNHDSDQYSVQTATFVVMSTSIKPLREE
jgi:hypothetical protein